ncbi:VCBS repeat-containing protein [Fulvivirgaceae bacterium BMA12]|uniref:VCBS repeat-containing protein n=1 Tax=Agaribacillus aureus TaxID=3051825 RepID=A0ABT8L5R7_9BACT|nr:VCBS repeat-containing protein [Fulvivirgaceae bacterium BMA12]
MKKKVYLSLLASLLLMLIYGCDSTNEGRLFIQKKPSETGLFFQNNLDERADFNILNYLYYYNGGGVGIGDFNNDGLQDIYFTANLEGNKLYINQGGLRFKDISDEAGVTGKADWATGVSIADVNADGWLDIYVCGLSGLEGRKSANELFINNGPSPSTGQITFTESAGEYGLDISSFSTQAAFFDYDNDGDLDMYLLNHAFHSVNSYAPRTVMLTRTDEAMGDKLFRNELSNGQKHFVEVTAASGILSTAIGFGLGIGCSDIDQDGWTDIYISNDFHENDYLLMNQRDGTFSEELSKWIGHTSKYSMGNDIADYNNDGLVDIVTMDMLPHHPDILQKSMAEDHYDLRDIILKNGYHPQLSRNCLQLNMGGKFSEIASFAGIEASDWSWAPLLADLDNDGLKDLYVSNGIFRRPNDLDYLNYTSQKAIQLVMGSKTETISRKLIEAMPQNPISNIAFKHAGELAFLDETERWGLDVPSHSNGAAYADLDNDGDLDLVLNNINEHALLFENKANQRPSDRGSYLQISFEGNNLNTTGVGAKAIIKHQGKTYYQEQMPVRGFMSSMSHVVHFGLGKLVQLDSVWIVWPGGSCQLLENVATNQMLKVRQGDASGNYYKIILDQTENVKPFKEIDAITFDYKHEENVFHDVHREYLIPRHISTEGPGVAVGDINDDGLDDVFFTNAQERLAGMFVQRSDGNFVRVNNTLFAQDSLYEGVDAAFFDADNDNDLDLFVVSAGNDYKEGEAPLRDRLYINNGQGNFAKAQHAIPQLYTNTSCVKPEDYDKDGDIDLFIGGRAIAGNYGISPKSYLLQNNGQGSFSMADVPQELSEAGMVTDAVWVDVDNNGWRDLVVVGEWMAITIYLNSDGILSPSDLSPENTNGWWNCVIADDFDMDGDMDLVAGNVGLNTKLNASVNEPVRLYIKDFDNNGSIDPVMTCYMQGEEYPFATKDVLAKQLVFLKKKFTSYGAYAGTTINKLFTPEQLKGTIIREAVEFRSIYFENDGNGKFKPIPLPAEANFSPIMSMISLDVNEDGLKDIVAGGNFYGFTPGMGRQDADYGLLLINKGGNAFKPLSHDQSGLMIEGQVRDMDLIKLSNGGMALIVARNNEAAMLFGIGKERTRLE